MISDRQRNVFDDLLEQVITDLPVALTDLMEEVPLIVEDEPSDELMMSMNLDRGNTELCGLHWGVPLTHRSVNAVAGMPDHMMLFRGPIMRLTGVSSGGGGVRFIGRHRGRGLKQQIRITLLHEIGHHFGLNEEQLADLGYG